MNDPSASTASPPSGSSSSGSMNILPVDVLVLEGCIDDVLSSLTDKGLRCKLLESGMKLRDVVQPVVSDFSKLFESISEGAKIISDKKSSSSKLSSEAQSVALDTVKQLGNVHWAAIGLLAIAFVLERFDKISTNDRDCLDLLKLMLDLAKFLMQLKDMNADSHKELSEKMNEALHLIVSGAILCRSFIAYKKLLKFFCTTKIRDELVYIRRKVDSIIGQLSLQMQVKVASFYMSQPQPQPQPQPHPNGAGGLAFEQSTTTNEIFQCEIEDAVQTETRAEESSIEMCTANTNVVSRVNQWKIEEAVSCESSNWVDRPQKSKRLLPTFFRLPKYLKKFRERRSRSERKQNPARKVVLGISLDKTQLSSFGIEHDSGGLPIHFTLKELKKATNEFRHELKVFNSWCNLFKGTLSSGRQVVVRTFPSQQATSSEQTLIRTTMKELVCLANLRHKNIVKLVGYCNLEKEEPMLVYDDLLNGRLSDFLFGDTTKGKKKEDSKQGKFLDWSDRLKIILGVISALVYLHEGADEHVCCVHRNINPRSILLDDNFNAKLSGFDLAEFLAFDDSGFSEPVAGTFGYIAPECISQNHLSSKADIYSFGILVLEIVSGRSVVYSTYNYDEDHVNLPDRAWRLYKEDNLADLIHPQLLEGKGYTSSSIIRSIKVALWCVVVDPYLRPTTSRVSAMLSTEEEIPPLPEDSMPVEQHFLKNRNTDEGYQSDIPMEEIEDLPR
ncbi:hypothetical protein SUGI_0703000 [Cryptomeria japonica]|uniref:uncharacterized protein LOC131056878 n=1 Tax=Cryptomeria japonica TaxID=3369 RepID=UPI002414861B|nr:uncharacterized protein LOC131056878 [Cryptomeria japonica]GLJ34933.1 hypothetical protein SUGI_0703000 [Cryptomeria japonica]